ncbi:MAG: Holliday junction branch migration protein RuvA [Deltaproteobacteria bacterium]|nr:Holliday junction branch migration protein RuvA [Deltaproteobacteria bacterium]
MIAFLDGELHEKRPDYVILNVGGVGYHAFIPLSTFYHLPEPPARVALQIYTHVQTDTLQLYGFATPDEKQTFIKLLAIPRVGPKLALNILSGISPQDLAQALMQGDIKRLAAIPGLGRKSAERLVVELKGKLGPAMPPLATAVAGPQGSLWDDALSALINLGYSRIHAEEVLRMVHAHEKPLTLEDILRHSLSRLAAQ